MDTKARLDALAGLRFVAAMAVALAHLPEISHDPALGRVANRFLSEGIYGLTIFFVLSGFVLAYGYLDRLAQPSLPALRGFYIARVARIWPLHLLTLGLVLAFPIGPAPEGFGPILANVFLVHSWVPSLEYIQSYNSVAWTLSLEWFFYLVCPLVLIAVGRWKSAGPTQLHLAALGVWLATIAVVLPFAGSEGFWPLYICNVCPAVRCGEFTIGVLLGAAFVRGRVRSGPLELARTRRL
jgi:peptidoglycan/LPS O-acetylase OafA/YrhL